VYAPFRGRRGGRGGRQPSKTSIHSRFRGWKRWWCEQRATTHENERVCTFSKVDPAHGCYGIGVAVRHVGGCSCSLRSRWRLRLLLLLSPFSTLSVGGAVVVSVLSSSPVQRESCDVARRSPPPRHVILPAGKGILIRIIEMKGEKIMRTLLLLVRFALALSVRCGVVVVVAYVV